MTAIYLAKLKRPLTKFSGNFSNVGSNNNPRWCHFVSDDPVQVVDRGERSRKDEGVTIIPANDFSLLIDSHFSSYR